MTLQSYEDIEHAIEQATRQYEAYYLDYWNNFLTVDGYAKYYGITREEAEQRIKAGRKIHDKYTSE